MPRVTITVPDGSPQPYRFQLDREVVRLGRGSENDIVIESGSVSTNHAEMRRITGGYELEDMGSTNGLKLDGSRYQTVPLVHGVSVAIGDAVFDFSLTDEEQYMLSTELPGHGAEPLPVPASTQPMGLAPAKKARSAPKRQVMVIEDHSNSGFFVSLLFILFSLAAFGAGLSIRHQKETGASLIDGVKAKFMAAPQPAAPAPSALDTMAPQPSAAPAAPLASPAPPAPVAPPIPAGPAAPPPPAQ